MRAFTVLSSVALLALAAGSAHAQASSNSSASPPSSAPASATQHSDRGYNSRAEKRRVHEAKRSGGVVPGYAQTEKPHSGNDAGNLVPFGPPA